jgi:hypothetical protein
MRPEQPKTQTEANLEYWATIKQQQVAALKVVNLGLEKFQGDAAMYQFYRQRLDEVMTAIERADVELTKLQTEIYS